MTNSEKTPRNLTSTLPIVAALATLACLVVPWQTESTAGESLWGSTSASVWGLSAAGAPLVIIALAIVAAAAFVARGSRRTTAAAAAGGALGGLGLIAVAVAALGTAGEDRFAVTTTTGVGTYATIAVGAVTVVTFLTAAGASARRPALAARTPTIST